ncbi:hypothetical protein AHF37_05274 [Paragonimus kellicotti]|nr:hypothetical protein AHF37_05274 [Paragonimus kellicotti]
MPPASDVQNANPPHLANNTFLVNLAVTFNVVSIPLAIFILIIVCIACVLFVVVVILIARSCVRRSFIPKKKRQPVKSIYLDEIPGMENDASEGKYGTLEYSLEYDLKRQHLVVGVCQANLLALPEGVEVLDPYVSVTVCKQQNGRTEPVGKINKSSVRKHTNRPSWNQTFSYNVPEHDLRHILIVFEAFDYDSIGQDNSIGQLQLLLKDLDEGEYAGKVLERTGWLKAGEACVDGIGEICIGLSYNPQFNRIDVTVYEARQLTISDKLSSDKAHRLSVQVELKHKKRSLGSNETKGKTEVINPYFNEKMSFPVKHVKPDDCFIVCRLKRHKGLGMRKSLGHAVIGSHSRISTGVKQWEEMIKGPAKTHVMWHSLLGGSED